MEHVLGQKVDDAAQVEGGEHHAHIGCCILDGLFGTDEVTVQGFAFGWVSEHPATAGSTSTGSHTCGTQSFKFARHPA